MIKKLLSMAALVALVSVSACDCDPTVGAYSAYIVSVTNTSLTTGTVIFSNGTTEEPFDYATQSEGNRKCFANSKNYSVRKNDDGTYTALRWEAFGIACDATDLSPVLDLKYRFSSLEEAKAYIHKMHTYFAKRLKSDNIVWGRKE
jgi:hypothetical protein